MSEQVDGQAGALTEARASALARAMDRLVGDHPDTQSVDEWFLIITLYANRLTDAENEFCKQHLSRRYNEKAELLSERRHRQWSRETKVLPKMEVLPKEGLMERETVFKGRVVGINLPRVRGNVVDNPDFVVVSVEAKADYSVVVRLNVPLESAKGFFAGQPVDIVIRPMEEVD